MSEQYQPTPRQPRLIWSGRDKRRESEPLPAQTVEVIRPFHAKADESLRLFQGESDIPENRLIWTNDNLVALTSLLHGDEQHAPLEGKVDLVYIDPPFAVQSDFKINVEIENGVSDEKLPTVIEELAYTDTWKNGLDSYLSMIRDRLYLIKALMAPTASIYLHCDWHAGHYLKVLMDEVFGYENFKNEIVWRRTGSNTAPSRYGNNCDLILFYTKSETYIWNQMYGDYDPDYIESHYTQYEPDGRRYQLVSTTGAGATASDYEWKGMVPPRGRHWAYSKTKMEELDKGNRLTYSKSGMPRVKYYLNEQLGPPLQCLWNDVKTVNSQAAERMSYPTQKPLALLQRIIAASSNPNDLVLDCFGGSGTTALAAETMKDSEGKAAPRRWISVDCGKFAIHITRKRLIEANARPFAVENIGFYSRAGEWKDLSNRSSAVAKYRDAMTRVYGGAPVEGFTYLHGKKGERWIHVGPLHAPVSEALVEKIAEEASVTDTKKIDVLTADIPIDFNKGIAEARWGVSIQAKVIPRAAVEAVRARLSRRAAKDPDLEIATDIHFFSPPDIEVRVLDEGDKRTIQVVLSRLTIDLDDCLSTQDAKKREDIKKAITDWRALVDLWAVDWDYNGEWFANDWQSFRTRKLRDINTQAVHTYLEGGEKRIAVKVTDIFGNDGLRVLSFVLPES